MQFKIDARDQYTVITPEKGSLDASLAADLAEQCQLLAGKGSKNFLVDLEHCQDVGTDFLNPFIELSSACYEREQSFVLTNPPADMIRIIKEEDAIDLLNYAPTIAEAADIICMEILERDLLAE
ncbi:MAG: STAS domain-containing protein [Chitinophagaceae bacterium]|nr:STAS domain-containing protein [Chitinophagaceae bacterium]